MPSAPPPRTATGVPSHDFTDCPDRSLWVQHFIAGWREAGGFAEIVSDRQELKQHLFHLVQSMQVRKVVRWDHAALRALDVDSVIELNKAAGEEVDVYLNDRPFASAEVVIINEAFGVRISSFVEGSES